MHFFISRSTQSWVRKNGDCKTCAEWEGHQIYTADHQPDSLRAYSRAIGKTTWIMQYFFHTPVFHSSILICVERRDEGIGEGFCTSAPYFWVACCGRDVCVLAWILYKLACIILAILDGEVFVPLISLVWGRVASITGLLWRDGQTSILSRRLDMRIATSPFPETMTMSSISTVKNCRLSRQLCQTFYRYFQKYIWVFASLLAKCIRHSLLLSSSVFVYTLKS